MEYAAEFATRRGLPLVINLSFGVGNEREGRATIDAAIDAFLGRHPDVVFVVAAGNDGPGLSTVGFPATADRVLTVGSTLPGAFARPGGPPPPDRPAFWSARGGEVGRPDLLAPGMAFTAVPAWDVGNEVKLGTSLSAPHVAGLVASLISAVRQDGRRFDAAQIVQALRATAVPLPGATALDQGAGLPRLDAAYQWLVAGHQGSAYVVRAQSGHSAAFRRNGFAGPGDTVERFTVRHVAGQRAARFTLRSEAAWLRTADSAVAAPGLTEIVVTHRAESLRAPGLYVGAVTARNPADTLAGALFRLISTVVVPYDLAARPLVETARVAAAGRVERRFLRVPQAGATLHVTVVLPDSASQTAFAALFDPGGRPVREAPLGIELGRDGGTGRFVIRAGDLVPGVYELAVVPSPLGPPEPATLSLRAELGPVLLAATAAGVELANPGSRAVTVRVTQQVVGAEGSTRLAARGASAESVWVHVPPWARHATVEVSVAPDFWPELTDLAVTVYDSSGFQVANEAQNYAVGQQAVPLDSVRAGRPLVIELMPAWADPAAVRAWEAGVRVRFFGDSTVVVGDTADVRVVAGGRVVVPRAAPRLAFVPEGLDPLVDIIVATEGGTAAIGRGIGGEP